MRVVILLEVGLRDVDIAVNFLADHAVRQVFVLRLQLEILEGYPAQLFLQPLVKLLGVRNLALGLNLRHSAIQVRIHVDIQLLALLHEQQLIDLIAKRLRGSLVHGGFERVARKALSAAADRER